MTKVYRAKFRPDMKQISLQYLTSFKNFKYWGYCFSWHTL